MLLLLLLLVCVGSADALCVRAGLPTSTLVRVRTPRMRDTDDVIGSPFLKAINSLQETIQQSPVANLKKGLAKLQAGNYDQPVVKAKLEQLIRENDVIMFSFTT
ncbi:hypothetical protein AB1Y20_019973 [Prymnesium parvum]|uniref:Uncharacterized protein n=1 Tax=Prymnesium parvum TaxID=97485 RepID=A0AB34JVW9_PRYPA